MPKHDSNIDTGNLGLALGIATPGHHQHGPQEVDGLFKVWFDTGIVMFVPGPLFDQMRLHLREAD